MSCAKQLVLAIIENDGRYWIGTNWCLRPQKTCPREGMKSGEGYEKCYEICMQSSHAEVDACKQAGWQADGAILYLIGHTYCCENCQQVMKEYGIKRIVIGEYPLAWESTK